MPEPPNRSVGFADLIEEEPASVGWDTPLQTKKLLLMMNKIHMQKVAAASTSEGPVVGAVFKRTRVEQGKKIQRAEIRFDGLVGCLRTPAGGSSRQQIIMIEDGGVIVKSGV
jgi:DNA (cytosine-5)-methyltransferase 1